MPSENTGPDRAAAGLPPGDHAATVGESEPVGIWDWLGTAFRPRTEPSVPGDRQMLRSSIDELDGRGPDVAAWVRAYVPRHRRDGPEIVPDPERAFTDRLRTYRRARHYVVRGRACIEVGCVVVDIAAWVTILVLVTRIPAAGPWTVAAFVLPAVLIAVRYLTYRYPYSRNLRIVGVLQVPVLALVACLAWLGYFRLLGVSLPPVSPPDAEALAVGTTGALVVLVVVDLLRRSRCHLAALAALNAPRAEIVCELTQVVTILTTPSPAPECEDRRMLLALEKIDRVQFLFRCSVVYLPFLSDRNADGKFKRGRRRLGRGIARELREHRHRMLDGPGRELVVFGLRSLAAAVLVHHEREWHEARVRARRGRRARRRALAGTLLRATTLLLVLFACLLGVQAVAAMPSEVVYGSLVLALGYLIIAALVRVLDVVFPELTSRALLDRVRHLIGSARPAAPQDDRAPDGGREDPDGP